MKIRNLLILLTFLVATSVLICIYTNDRSSFQTIIAETHKQLANLKHLQVNLKQHEQRELITEEKYLIALGFVSQPNLYKEDEKRDFSLPVLVTAVSPGQFQQAIEFVKASHHFLPDYPVLIYTLNLERNELNMLNRSCNSSTCIVRRFDLEFYPKHVSDISVSAHRPLIIQHSLNQMGAILWLDITYRINSNNIYSVVQCAKQNGVASWPSNKPTSSLTHPGMFEFFHTQQENFYFHRMVDLSHIIIYNTPKIHKDLMLPWVKCTLIAECIAPIGAQSGGCRFDKRPLYRYSGCHHYDESALNVALGVMFHYDAFLYLVTDNLFRSVEQENVTNYIDSEHYT
uniref:Hexosyltransferase n=1 Tax=Strigamia maritima TaxID=126957 RepID=T1JNL5_STRMM